MNKSVYENYSEAKLKKAFDFCEGYKKFITDAKTEREAVCETVKIAENAGFKNINLFKKLKPGDKVYSVNMDKAVFLAIIGSDPIENGLNIIGSHIDSPRLDLKPFPIYEDSSSKLCLFDTHYYGGIKKYQWTATPLALHGVVCKKDGTKINICYGENENEPVLGISDLLPHLDRESRKEVVTGEELNLIVGSIPNKKEKNENKVKSNILNILKEKGIEEEDFFSSEIEIVPAGKARDFGLDKSMVIGYGQDDKVCAYPSIIALLNAKKPKKTCVCLLVDKEEIGSVGATGMESMFFENSIASIIDLSGKYSSIKLRSCLAKSKMLSSDVTAAFDPNRPEPFNKATEAFLGHGIAFCKYTGSRGKSGASDANPEYIASLRKILDENKIQFQATEMGKVEAGGGGTIAYIMAKYNMDVIDAGVPVLSMHAPWEITAKVDIYETYLCYLAFYENI